VEEAAEALHVSPETVMRDWRVAKAWPYKELARGENARRDGHRRGGRGTRWTLHQRWGM